MQTQKEMPRPNQQPYSITGGGLFDCVTAEKAGGKGNPMRAEQMSGSVGNSLSMFNFQCAMLNVQSKASYPFLLLVTPAGPLQETRRRRWMIECSR